MGLLNLLRERELHGNHWPHSIRQLESCNELVKFAVQRHNAVTKDGPNVTSNAGPNTTERLGASHQLPSTGPHAQSVHSGGDNARASGIRQELKAWVDRNLLYNCEVNYAQLDALPRSTIDIAFSPDGRKLASSHGDHTVKITCCQTGKCIGQLVGHHRTPWVVRFHPLKAHLLASGSLDHQVRLWDVRTGKCIAWQEFGRPISSIAFNVLADELLVASGHKLYAWQYLQPAKNQDGRDGRKPIVLKTRRSLRAVHFAPHGLPLLLTAEVVADYPPRGRGTARIPQQTAGRVSAPAEQAAAENVGAAVEQQRTTHNGLTHQIGTSVAELLRQRNASLDQAHQSTSSGTAAQPNAASQQYYPGLTTMDSANSRIQPQSSDRAPNQLSQFVQQAAHEAVSAPPMAPTAVESSQTEATAFTSSVQPALESRHSGSADALPHQNPSSGTTSEALRTAHPLNVLLASQSYGELPPDQGSTNDRRRMPRQLRVPSQSLPPPVLAQPDRDRAAARGPNARDPEVTGPNALLPSRQVGGPFQMAQQSTSHEQPPAEVSDARTRGSIGENTMQLPHFETAPYRPESMQLPHLSDALERHVLRQHHGGSLAYAERDTSNSAHDAWRPTLGMPAINPDFVQLLAELYEARGPVASDDEYEHESRLTSPTSEALRSGSSGLLPGVGSINLMLESASLNQHSNSHTSALGESHLQTVRRSPQSANHQAEQSVQHRGQQQQQQPHHANNAQPQSARRDPASVSRRSLDRSAAQQPTLLPRDIGYPLAVDANRLRPPLPSRRSLEQNQSTLTASALPQVDVRHNDDHISASGAALHSQGQQQHEQQQQQQQESVLAGRQHGEEEAAASHDALRLLQQQAGVHPQQQQLQHIRGQQYMQEIWAQMQQQQQHARGQQELQRMQALLRTERDRMQQLRQRYQLLQQLGPQGSRALLRPALDGMLPGELPGHQLGRREALLPPSLVDMGWEWPITGYGSGGATGPAAARAIQASASAANAIGEELPCRVRIKLWRWPPTPPCGTSDGSVTRVKPLSAPFATINDAVLCSEMGVSFSACGRFLAACVVCQGGRNTAAAAWGTSPGAYSYEVCVFSLQPGEGFGKRLGGVPVVAAHCLTSVQFSPATSYLLLAYGRRHLALLRSLASDGTSIIPMHTIVEVYRLPDMALVRVLPSAEDELNVATFHPFPGGGLAYGTKDGRVRLLRPPQLLGSRPESSATGVPVADEGIISALFPRGPAPRADGEDDSNTDEDENAMLADEFDAVAAQMQAVVSANNGADLTDEEMLQLDWEAAI